MPACAVVGCSRRYRAGEEVRLFSLPTVITNQCEKTKELSSKRRVKWLKRINRIMTQKKVDGLNVRVCDRHFISGKPSALFERTHPDWAPSLHLGYERKKGIDTAVTRNHRLEERRRKNSTILPSLENQPANMESGDDVVNVNQEGEVEFTHSRVDVCQAIDLKSDENTGNAGQFEQTEPQRSSTYELPSSANLYEQPALEVARRRSHMKYQVLMEKRNVQLDHNETPSHNTPGPSTRISGQTLRTSGDVTCIKEELVDDSIEDYYTMIKEELPANDVKIVQDPLSISSDIKEETPISTQTGPSARITGQTIHPSDDVACIKEELVDDAIDDHYKMIKEELPTNDVKIVQDPLSISSDIKEETPTLTQTGSHVGLPATDPSTVAADVKEEWIDDVTWKDFEKDDTTNSVTDVFAVKEENDDISRQIGVFVDCKQAGPSEDVMIEFENFVGKAQMVSGGMTGITFKKNKICNQWKTYSCYTCAYSSESKAKLRRHVVEHFEWRSYACDVCESRFTRSSSLKRHMLTHNGQKPYSCDICESKFAYSSSLKRHMLTHNGEKPYACDVCESRFIQSSHLKSHMLTHIGEKPYACGVCESRFTRSSHLERHMLTHNGEKPYACNVCENRFIQSSSLKKHMLTHSGEKPNACDVCESKFAYSSSLKRHMLTHNGEKPYACDVCDSRFTRSHNLEKHMLTHSGEEPYGCDVCESRFTQSSRLKRHKQTHSGKKPYACDVCESRFSQSGNLMRHMLTHSGGTPYACDVCESRFTRSSNVKRHMLTHIGEKPHACDACESRFTQSHNLKKHMLTHRAEELHACDVCESGFSQSGTLMRHMLTHSGEKPYACNVCESRFTRSHHLKKHMLTHSGEKPYACDVCENRFIQSISLKRHMLTHSGEKPYSCDICESKFAYFSYLKRHMLTHNGDKPYACDVCESRFTQSSNMKRHMLTHS